MANCTNCGRPLQEGTYACPYCTPNFAPTYIPPGSGYYVSAPQTSGLAIASIVVGILSVCCCNLLGILAIILGLVAISQINKSGGRITGKGLATGGIVIGGLSMLLMVLYLILQLINIVPMFQDEQFKKEIKEIWDEIHNIQNGITVPQKAALQAEAKANLGAIYISEIAYFAEHNNYGSTFEELYWLPDGSTNYAYFIGDDVVQAANGGPYSLPYEVNVDVRLNGFAAAAVGNIDNDDTLDVWIIDENKNLNNIINDLSD